MHSLTIFAALVVVMAALHAAIQGQERSKGVDGGGPSPAMTINFWPNSAGAASKIGAAKRSK